VERFYGVFFKDWNSGFEAVRKVVQSRIPVSMLRLSDPLETQTTMVLSGQDRMVDIASMVMQTLGYGEGRSLLIMGITGDRRAALSTRSQAMAILREHGSLPGIATIGDMWRKSRFQSAYLRNTLWDMGYAVDTLETAASWATIPELVKEILSAMHESIKRLDERVLNFSHLSHHYLDGASIYVTFIFRRGADPNETLRRWQALKEAATQVIIEKGATISHQHGVGHDHAPYLQHEKGKLGISLLQASRKSLDPDGIMNPGKLLGPL
jgi:alkyldihydroxyacetonephosphate synthase